MYQPQFRGHPSHQGSQRSPHGMAPGAGTARRTTGPQDVAPPNAVAQAHAQAAAQQAQNLRASAALVERAKIRAKRPTDKSMPEGVENVIIGDGVKRYRDLRELERKLDATMLRKRADMLDGVNRNTKRYRTLRVWISNTVEDQAWQADGLHVDAFDFSSGLDASWRVKIEGRLLEDSDDAESDDDDQPADENPDSDKMSLDATKAIADSVPKYRLSHFFKGMTVDFDRPRFAGKDAADQSVEWKKPQIASNTTSLPNAADFDQLEFKRAGDENINITINLVRDENPEIFRLSPTLADIVDMSEATRAEATMAIWEYIRVNNLQDDDEKRTFECDDRLRALTGRDKAHIPHLPEFVVQNSISLHPIKLPYTIRCDRAFHTSDPPAPFTVYDIRVQLPDPLRAALSVYLTNSSYVTTLREIHDFNNHTALLVQAIAQSKNRHMFFEGLACNPTVFLRKWLGSQKRDLEIMGGEASRGGGEGADSDEWRRGGPGSVWASRRARESVGVLVAGRGR